jgi:hypothetical protein
VHDAVFYRPGDLREVPAGTPELVDGRRERLLGLDEPRACVGHPLTGLPGRRAGVIYAAIEFRGRRALRRGGQAVKEGIELFLAT